VAAGIANDGVVPEPTLIDQVTTPDGRVVERADREPWKTAISSQVASTLTDMMRNVVETGSGQQAQIPGVEVAGKTGTADAPSGNITWFIAFAPADDPKVAVAVAIEGQPSGQTGGAVSAPIARQVMEALLAGGSAA
jgi:peptidoglycan glycosyltransferase